MSSLLAIIIASIVFGLRIAYKWKENRTSVNMLPVEAGPLEVANRDFTGMECVRMGAAAKALNPDLMHFVVHNDCMMSRGIMPGDVVEVHPFSESFTIADTTPDDILLIHIDDERFQGHKIRVRGERDDANQVCHTYYYKGSTKVMSAHPHTMDKIKGVVENVFHVC